MSLDQKTPFCLTEGVLDPGVNVAGRPAAGEREVLLSFLAPKPVLERFLADLRQQGLEVCEAPLIPGILLTCGSNPVTCSKVMRPARGRASGGAPRPGWG